MEFPHLYEFPRTKTIGGCSVVLFKNEAGGNYPILGAYWSGERWIPSAWTKEGYKFLDVPIHELNIVM